MEEGIENDILAALNPAALHLILFPTEKCNFRCTYCYEDFEIGKMSPEIVQAIKTLLSHRASSLSRLEISWFGGEPLLARDVIESITLHILSIVANRPSLEYSANMTTNGYLLSSAIAMRLTELGIGTYQVSLDGDLAGHNNTRLSAAGDGTFQRIWENLLSIRDNNSIAAKIILRVHYTPSTYDAVEKFADRLNAEFRDDPRFRIHFKTIERFGGRNDLQIPVYDRLGKATSKAKLDSLLDNPLQAFNPSEEFSNSGQYICYAAKANSFAIRADGSLAKCTVALSNRQNALGRIRPDGSLEMHQERWRYWLTGLVSRDTGALACPMKGLGVSSSKHGKVVPISAI